MDDYTDGELFWWITHGMAGTAMPGWQELLTETQRWQLIHYVRQIRRQASTASHP
ncbi:MAG: cytochrome c [Candidatus Tectomicrobia bacterium]|uniref:Cytochrome c n=1 Tax=Tectimicrobiota bacterium TaxID=2528274 RepID=A0A937W6P9_UNCTE|nr:cytochrome c [Candidatus Tectomicrobia bacterium]